MCITLCVSVCVRVCVKVCGVKRTCKCGWVRMYMSVTVSKCVCRYVHSGKCVDGEVCVAMECLRVNVCVDV